MDEVRLPEDEAGSDGFMVSGSRYPFLRRRASAADASRLRLAEADRGARQTDERNMIEDRAYVSQLKSDVTFLGESGCLNFVFWQSIWLTITSFEDSASAP